MLEAADAPRPATPPKRMGCAGETVRLSLYMATGPVVTACRRLQGPRGGGTGRGARVCVRAAPSRTERMLCAEREGEEVFEFVRPPGGSSVWGQGLARVPCYVSGEGCKSC
eukprot:3461687-Prymnesium_polylepis.1